MAGRAAVVLLGEPGPVVAREDEKRVPVEAHLRQRGSQTSDTVVHLLDDIAIGTTRAPALVLVVGEQRDVGSVVREVDEERPLAVCANEVDRALDVPAGQGLLMGGALDDLAAAEDGHVEVLVLRRSDEGVFRRTVG
jgi:hypothetical protein